MKLPRRQFLHLAAGAAALPFAPHGAEAQAYPSKQIRLVVPFPPGGAFDLVARPWAEKMKSLLGTVVIENIGGGGASIGSAAVARAQPDGYTLLTAGTLTHINEALIKARPLYDPVKDIDPISSIAVVVLGIVILANTIGMTDVACFAARTCGVPEVTMTSTLSRTNSAAIWTKRSARPSDQRYSIVMVRPSIQPSSRSRCVKAATNSLSAERVLWPENPTVRSFPGCCARAVSGHTAAPLPSSVMKSRRLIN
jgi:hypothetical protein